MVHTATTAIDDGTEQEAPETLQQIAEETTTTAAATTATASTTCSDSDITGGMQDVDCHSYEPLQQQHQQQSQQHQQQQVNLTNKPQQSSAAETPRDTTNGDRHHTGACVSKHCSLIK